MKNRTKTINLACVITTYDKILEAKIQMEIMRAYWQPHFKSITIVHEYSGKREWYKQQYKEDVLRRQSPLPHYFGATDLINQGIADALLLKRQVDYIVVSSADTWIIDPMKIVSIIATLAEKKYELATTLWAGPFLATEFFIITPDLARVVFPLDYQSFIKRNHLLTYFNKTQLPMVEGYFAYQMVKKAGSRQKIHLIPGRRLFLPLFNRYHSENFYSSHHNHAIKRRYVKRHITRFLNEEILKKTPLLEQFLTEEGA